MRPSRFTVKPKPDDAWDGRPRMVPVFALPATVLFPLTYLPLHIFEARYREMVGDALPGDRLITVALLKEGWESNYYGNPPIHSIGCLGRIEEARRLEDGRYNIVLRGVQKVVVKDPSYDKNYRRAWIEPSQPEVRTPSVFHKTFHNELVEDLKVYARLRGWESQVDAFLEMKMDQDHLVQVLSSELDLTPLEKQFLLEAESPLQQARRLVEFIRFMTAEVQSRNQADRPKDTGN